MKDFDGVNFQCTECNLLRYKDDYHQERWLEKHGAKRCPVCGHIAIQPGILPNNGNGHVCLHCKAEYEHDEDSGRYDIYPLSRLLRPEINHHGSITLKLGAIFWIFMIYLAGCAMIVKADYEAIDVEFSSDPWFDDFNIPINVDTMTANDTVIGEWERDFGDDMPNGTYYGTLFPPAFFEHNYQPVWKHVDHDGLWYHPERPDEYGNIGTYVMLTSHFNLSFQKIMSGASEWWVRLPIHPDSIEPEYGITIAIFEGEDNVSKPYLEEHMQYYRLGVRNLSGDIHGQNGFSAVPGDAEVFPTVDGYTPDKIVRIRELPGELGDRLTASVGRNYRITNDHVYIQIDAVIEPATSYLFSLVVRLPKDGTLPEGGTLGTYWTTAESPAGKETGFYTATVFHSWPSSIMNTRVEDDSYVQTLPLDLDWSFVFVEGVGMGGFFGKRVEITSGDSLLFRPYFNLSEGEKFMSFMIPLISSDTLEVIPRVWNGIVPHETFLPPLLNLWRFEDGSYWFNNTIGWDYHDFILFSTDQLLNSTDFGLNNSWNVAVELLFNASATVTLLCYEEDRPIVTWQSLNLTGWANASTNPYFGSEFWDNETKTMSNFHYKVYCSARSTDGQWVLRNGNASTGYTYSHYFPRKILLSSAEFEFVNGTRSENLQMTDWDLAMYHWNTYSPGHKLKALWYAIKAVVMKLWNSGSEFGGYIRDGLSQVWEDFKRFGSWIYTHIIEFVGKIWNFIQDAVDIIAGFWESFKYLVGPVILLLIVGGGGKLARKVLGEKGT